MHCLLSVVIEIENDIKCLSEKHFFGDQSAPKPPSPPPLKPPHHHYFQHLGEIVPNCVCVRVRAHVYPA